jgi:hypothetical protein
MSNVYMINLVIIMSVTKFENLRIWKFVKILIFFRFCFTEIICFASNY